ncbi:uncharacterized protein LOC116308242 [Actinia tenebrosa]|uniref:Uncharacterized protein LOC116308242 n=1 Tax=Actinia tenebrosa TaxID=6105 RepID=A0A6P8J9R0_ACTTE|nr:uncharacterized protein LOC116308242 [Actinia tenebrosa]
MLSPGTAQNFEEYFNDVFAPFILKQVEKVKRVDVVWDVYRDDSLKKATRQKRGSGQRRKALMSTRIPSDWKGFLRNDENKTELFQLLAVNLMSLKMPVGKEIYSTHGEIVLSSTNRTEMEYLAPSTHEEADTRLMIHVMDASACGHRRVMVRSNDADVVLLAVSIFNLLQVDELWVTYGSGKHLQFLPAHSIAGSLGTERASVLPLFHALTGCDTVSFFNGKGKKTAWNVWDVYPELTPKLKALKSLPGDVDDECIAIIERFVVLLYDRTSNLAQVNKARQELFSQKSRPLDAIPPTRLKP